MLRDLGLSGLIGVLALVGGFAVLGYVDPIVAGGVGLIVVGAILLLHAVVKALAGRLGMGDMI